MKGIRWLLLRLIGILTPSAPNMLSDVLSYSPKLSLEFPCKQVGRFLFFINRQFAVYDQLLCSHYQITYFVSTM